MLNNGRRPTDFSLGNGSDFRLLNRYKRLDVPQLEVGSIWMGKRPR